MCIRLSFHSQVPVVRTLTITISMRSAQYDITRIVGLSKSPVTVLQKLKLKQNKIRTEAEAETNAIAQRPQQLLDSF